MEELKKNKLEEKIYISGLQNKLKREKIYFKNRVLYRIYFYSFYINYTFSLWTSNLALVNFSSCILWNFLMGADIVCWLREIYYLFDP